MIRKLLLNALLFQASWFACVLSPHAHWLLAVPVLALLAHFRWVARWREEGKLVASVLIAGSALDSFLLQLGVFDFGEARRLIPLWLALLWAIFATTLNHCLAWSARPWWLGSLLGAVAGPLSYWAGAHLAGVALPLGTAPTLLLLAGLWALVVPVLHGFAALYREQARRRG